MSTELRFTSEIGVEEIQAVGDDRTIVRAARVSTGKDAGEITESEASGLINYLMKNRHGTPFEHGSLTVRVHAPIKVWREWHRHRIGWSYNEESGRYKDLEPVFYVPPRERPLYRPEGFKSARPLFLTADEWVRESHRAAGESIVSVGEYRDQADEAYNVVCGTLMEGYRKSYELYRFLLLQQVDRGLARDVLGVGIYSACYCTANPRSIMAFLELRTDHPEARRPSKPLYEIRVAADKLEAIFAARWPLTHSAWVENGRAAP